MNEKAEIFLKGKRIIESTDLIFRTKEQRTNDLIYFTIVNKSLVELMAEFANSQIIEYRAKLINLI